MPGQLLSPGVRLGRRWGRRRQHVIVGMPRASLRSTLPLAADAEATASAGTGANLALAWQACGALALAFWVTAVRYRSFDLGVSDADESLFILIGQAWLHGQLPYVAIWDVKPPGLFLLFALAQFVVGPGILAARVLTAAAVFAGSLALYRFSRRHLAEIGRAS